MKEIVSAQKLEDYFITYGLNNIFKENMYDYCRIFEYGKGEMICENGNKISYLFLLVEGEAKVFTTLGNGKIYLLRIENPLSVYGDLETLMEHEYTANVEALNKCICIGIPMVHIRRAYLDHAPFLKFLCLSLANRLDKVSQMSTSNILLPLKNKLASYLLAHKELDTNNINVKSSFVDIAEQLGTTYRHLNRTINEMCLEGLINKRGKIMEIARIEDLKSLAGHTYRY
ncbi:cyclic nucleotide-binding domain-containing protein [Petrocella sp. FN5]|uniref:cyclic nucleotide-binding domain-containing protein n=1 Tax=Petrocella sp. FN5 TaxID=3032002 RepID=UPI0023DCE08B|nr:cyclic nucleotide-binding domain-containing protein [Petrocella sp. FN5]MDF1618492.1 cyclic nucleotide-binding domain-containing protein [Petrocella sp. FN5]